MPASVLVSAPDPALQTAFPTVSGSGDSVRRPSDRPDRDAPSRHAGRYLEHAALLARLRTRADAEASVVPSPGPTTRVDTGSVMAALAPLLLETGRGAFGTPTAGAAVRRSLAPLPGGRALAVDVLPAVLRFDPQDLGRLLGELVDNGRRHAPAGATVRLRGAPGAGGYQLSVTNPGEPLPRWALTVLRADPVLDEVAADPAGRAFGLRIATMLARLNDARLEVLRGAGHPNTLRVIVRPA
jgi:hypothetical protein